MNAWEMNADTDIQEITNQVKKNSPFQFPLCLQLQLIKVSIVGKKFLRIRVYLLKTSTIIFFNSDEFDAEDECYSAEK